MDGFQYGNRNPAMKVGVIDNVVFLDHLLIESYQANAKSASERNYCLEGAGSASVYNAMPGDTWLIPRTTRMGDDADESVAAAMSGVVALNGAPYYDAATHMDFENGFTWGGINQSEQMVENPNDPANPGSGNQGAASFVAGKMTIPWRSLHTGYAGDQIAWTVYGPKHPRGNANGQIPYVPGTTRGAIVAAYEPYNPADFGVQCAAALDALRVPKSSGGIQDMSYAETLPVFSASAHGRLTHSNTCTQEVATAFKFGLWGAGLVLIQTLMKDGWLQPGPKLLDEANGDVDERVRVANLANAIGLWNTSGTADDVLERGLANVLLGSGSPVSPTARQAEDDFENTAEHVKGAKGTKLYQHRSNVPSNDIYAMYDHLRANLPETLFGGIGTAMEWKRSHIVGMLLSNAEPGQDVDVIFGMHTK